MFLKRKKTPEKTPEKTSQSYEQLKKEAQGLESILTICPHDGVSSFKLGNVLLQMNQPDPAIRWLNSALSRLPHKAPVFNNLGKAFLLKGDDAQADAYFNKAIKEDPDLAEAWFNQAEMCAKKGHWNQAVDLYQQAIRLNPEMSAALNNCGHILRKLRRYEKALELFHALIKLEPNLAEAHYNLGSTYHDIEHYENAVKWLSGAIQLKPDYAEAWNNMALTCKNSGDYPRALTYFKRALDINPNLSVAHWNRGFVHLLLGDWIEGWKDFEWRFTIPAHKTLYPHKITGILWDGHPIPDMTLLVHDEQGLGDTFQFLRFLPQVRRRCGRMILETRQELAELLRDQACIDEIVVRSPDYPPETAFNQYVPLMSLAKILGITAESKTFDAPYVVSPVEKTTYWNDRLPKDVFKVGLVWAGRPEHANDKNRSCQLEALKPLFELEHVRFFGLQKGLAETNIDHPGIASNFINLGPELQNFADTAGLLDNLDILITVDTSVAHLAGAMGRPVWLMVPYIPDWRWGLYDSTTPWYPSMTLFRQPLPKDWEAVIDTIRRQLIHKTKKF